MVDSEWVEELEQRRKRSQPANEAIDLFLGGPATNTIDWQDAYAGQQVSMRLNHLLELCWHPNQKRYVCEAIAAHIENPESKEWVLGFLPAEATQSVP